VRSSVSVSPWASARARSELIARIPVIAYCVDAAGLSELTERLARRADLELKQAAQSLGQLSDAVLRARESVVIARLDGRSDALPELIAHSDGLPVLALLNTDEDARQALRAGARAVLASGASAAQIAAAAAGAFHGLAVLPADAISLLERSSALEMAEPLTPREIEILGLLAAGDSNKTIAARLSISVHTVKFHISSILSKLGVSSRTEAVALGLRLGIVLL